MLVAQAPARNSDSCCGNSTLPFCVSGCALCVDVIDVWNHAESGKLVSRSMCEDFLSLSCVIEAAVFSVYPLSLKSRPSCVSCGGVVWHWLHVYPVCRAKLGTANADRENVRRTSTTRKDVPRTDCMFRDCSLLINDLRHSSDM